MTIHLIPLRGRYGLIRLVRAHVSPPGHLAVHQLDPIAGFVGEDNLGLWGVTEVHSGRSLGYGFTLQEALYFRAKLDSLWPKPWVEPSGLPACPTEIVEKVQNLTEYLKDAGIPSWEI
jgi:hypothetical protein